MRIAIVGTGYVGLVSGVCFADFGHEVVCIDKDLSKIEALKAGRMPIFEPGLAEIVHSNVKAGRLSFSSDLIDGVRDAKAIFIAVGTPAIPETGMADMRFVHQAAREIAGAINGFTVIVNKSTSPVGACDDISAIVAAASPHASFAVVSNPEFLREGAAIEDFKSPDRVVLGVEDPRALEVMREIYLPLEQRGARILCTTRRSAELVKYAANVFLAMKVTFINEIADLCEKIGADVKDVSVGVGLDSRIGRKFLNPGPGFGGSCFPKDTMALMKIGRDLDAPVRLVETLVEVNEERKLAMARKIASAIDGPLCGKKIGVLGLTYKPNTDDMRDSPSLTIIPALLSAGAVVVAHDPEGMNSAAKLLPGVHFVNSPEECFDGVDVIVLMTEWEQFRHLDFAHLKRLMRSPSLVDLRNLYDGATIEGAGLSYQGIGVASLISLETKRRRLASRIYDKTT